MQAIANLKELLRQRDDYLKELHRNMKHSQALAAFYKAKCRAEKPEEPHDSGLEETYVEEVANLKENLKQRDDYLEKLHRKLKQSQWLAAVYKAKWRTEKPEEPSDSGESDSWEPGSSIGHPLPTALLRSDPRVVS